MAEMQRSIGMWAAALVAVVFGVLTIKSGGAVLFGGGEAREAAGHYVPFVVWFNFLAGFLYVIAGLGVWARQRWAAWLAVIVAAMTLLVFTAFGVHVLLGGDFEPRTVGAMSLRSLVWVTLAVAGWRWFLRGH